MQLKSHPIEKTAEQLRQSIKRLEVYKSIHGGNGDLINSLIRSMENTLSAIPEEYRK